ncbi:MAG TPA: YcaO-like family protein, partial [Burkholderiales bacterium]|nr:YcaO-like family protein [Burkholderiales bacterium]
PEIYTPAARVRRSDIFRQMVSTASPERAFQHVPTLESPSVEDDLRWMLARLRASGCDQVAAVDLTRIALGIPVARVIVPGLEGAWDEAYVPGTRARRRQRSVT